MSRKRPSGWAGPNDKRRRQAVDRDRADNQIIALLTNIDARLTSIDGRLTNINGRLEHLEDPERQGPSPGSSSQRRFASYPAGSWTFTESPKVLTATGGAVPASSSQVRSSWPGVSDRSSGDSPSVAGYGVLQQHSLRGQLYPTNPGASSNCTSLIHSCSDTHAAEVNQAYFPCGPSSGKPGQPNWGHPEWPYRDCLTKLQFNNEPLKQGSGIYELKMKFNNDPQADDQEANFQEAGVIIGGVGFYNNGIVVAEGDDWERLLSNQHQPQLPCSQGAGSVPMWHAQQLSEPWADGDLLMFQIDTNENTIIFQRANNNQTNLVSVSQFTNNQTNLHSVSLSAFCGGYTDGVIKVSATPKITMRLTIQE